MILLLRTIIVAACLLLSAQQAHAERQARDAVAFVVLGKTSNHRQVRDGQHTLLNYHFFAEIFLSGNTGIRNASLITPGRTATPLYFDGQATVLEVHGGRYQDEEELDAAFPDGEYTFSYDLPDNTVVRQAVLLENRAGHSRIPEPVDIHLFQDDLPASSANIDADRDLTVRWSTFKSGSTDPKGIVDDLVFVVTADCHGDKIDHSGGPFGDEAYLTFASTEYVIPSSKLKPGDRYQLFVEHAGMDTSIQAGVPAIATYATTSFLDLQTGGAGKAGQLACPEPMPAMDGGQTDRPPRQGRTAGRL